MRRALLLALMFLGCAPRAPVPPGVPAPPVLDAVAPEQRRRMFLLRGNVSPEATVRLFTDSACAGPVYLQTTGVALREGLRVELIAGTENVFSADAINAEGGVSVCSNAVSMKYVPAVRPGQPSVRLTPNSPSAATQFHLQGAIDSFARAQLHEGDCSTPVVAELDANAFFSPGFVVEAPVNGSHTVAVEAVNEDEHSLCVAVTAINDSSPPVFTARLASPTPSPSGLGYVALSGDRLGLAYFYDGPNCIGLQLSYCRYCTFAVVPFLGATTEFSVQAWDEAGNASCVRGSRPWAFDATVPQPQAIVLLPGDPPQVEVPVGVEWTQLFYSPDCSGEVMFSQSVSILITTGVYLPWRPFEGTITVRGVRQDGGVDPCSNALPVSLP